MLASYGSREGVEQAVGVLVGRPLGDQEREQAIAATLAGATDAKREWTERGMIADVGPLLRNFVGPVRVVVGELDPVEGPNGLRSTFARGLRQAVVETVPAAGHLLPIERPSAVASACRDIGFGTPGA